MPLDLVERARRGDHDAFAVLARTSIFRLDAAARLILRDRPQDAVQERSSALARPAHVAERRSLDAWLHRLLVCIDEAAGRRHLDVD